MKYKAAEVAESLATLHEWLDDYEGDVFTILRYRNGNAALNDITPIIFLNGDPRYLTWHVAVVLGNRIVNEGVRVQGGGMDMGFHLVSSLSVALYGHEDRGGYRLRQRWL